ARRPPALGLCNRRLRGIPLRPGPVGGGSPRCLPLGEALGVVDAEGVVECGASPKGRQRGDPPPAALASSPPSIDLVGRDYAGAAPRPLARAHGGSAIKLLAHGAGGGAGNVGSG